ncbi:5'/3'-nucleotidase SurE [Salinispira pacifica]
MRILLTNDDGIKSAGIAILKQYLEPEHEVWTVAPDGERSGMSHYLTLKDPVRARQIDDRSYMTTGSPADCVIVALMGILPERPDIVLSGINVGPNLGTDLIYSGTAAAARQAAFMGCPAAALSLNGFAEPLHFDPLACFVRDNLALLRELWDPHHFININAPNIRGDSLPVEITSPSRRVYHDLLVDYESPRGETFFFLDGSPPLAEPDEQSDWAAVQRGSISVSPIYLHPLNHFEDDRYQTARFAGAAGQAAADDSAVGANGGGAGRHRA